MRLPHTRSQEADLRQAEVFQPDNSPYLVRFINVLSVGKGEGFNVLLLFEDQHVHPGVPAEEKAVFVVIQRFHRKVDTRFVGKRPATRWTKGSAVAAFIAQVPDIQDLQGLTGPEFQVGDEADRTIFVQDGLDRKSVV